LAAVARMRTEAEELIVRRMAGVELRVESQHDDEWAPPSEEALRSFVSKIPEIILEANRLAQDDLESGTSLAMAGAKMRIIQVVTRLLVFLAEWYPPHHFGARPTAEFFADLESERFKLYRNLWEGGGNKGTIVSVIIPQAVLEDMQSLLSTTVQSLLWGDDDINDWQRRFEAAISR